MWANIEITFNVSYIFYLLLNARPLLFAHLFSTENNMNSCNLRTYIDKTDQVITY